MNIVMVGARKFPVIKAAVAVCELMNTFDREQDVIHSRGSEDSVDAFILEAAKIMGFPTMKWPADGGASNYRRDVDLAKQADVIYAFFEADHVGEGGTQHVVEKGLDNGKSVHCYTWDGRLVLTGSIDASHSDTGGDEGAVDGYSEVKREAPQEPVGASSEGSQGRGGIGFASGERREDDSGAHPGD